MRVFAFLAAALAATAACSGDDSEVCEALAADCTPQYAPTFDNVFTNTLSVQCALPGSACHSAAGARAGLIFDDANQAFDLLTTTRTVVVAGDPCASELGLRITAEPANVQMPPGAPLSPGEQCAIIKWIEAGAGR